jgi:hypothetical protein
MTQQNNNNNVFAEKNDTMNMTQKIEMTEEGLTQKGPSLEQELSQLRRAVEHLQALKAEPVSQKPAEYVSKGNPDFSMFNPSPDIFGYSELDFDFSAPEIEPLRKYSLMFSLCDLRIQQRGRKHKFLSLRQLANTDARAIADTHSLVPHSDPRNLLANFEVSIAAESYELQENGGEVMRNLVKNESMQYILQNHDKIMMGDGILNSIDGICGNIPAGSVRLNIEDETFVEQIVNKLIEMKNALPTIYQDGAVFLMHPKNLIRVEAAMKHEGEKLNVLPFLHKMKLHSSEYFSEKMILLFNPMQYRIVASNILLKNNDTIRRGEVIIYMKQYVAAKVMSEKAFVYLNID